MNEYVIYLVISGCTLFYIFNVNENLRVERYYEKNKFCLYAFRFSKYIIIATFFISLKSVIKDLFFKK